MKKTLLVLTSLFFCAMLSAQVKSNLIFFTEQGEGFQLVLNGILQNSKAETNVKVTDLPAPNYKVKIIFADASLGQLDKNLMFNQGTESTFCIKKNNKGEYVIRYMNEVPVAQALPPAPNQTLVVFSTTPPPPPVVQQTTTTTTTTTGANPNGTSMGLSINDPNLGVNINMNVGGANTTSSSTTTTYSSTTTTTTPRGGAVNNNTQPAGGIYVMPGYNGAVGCPWPMSPSDFSDVKNSIESKTFDDSKLTIAKQVISSNCLLCSQVKEIMLLFTFETTRLDLAKYSYGYTYDIGNYYKLNDAFTFESSIDELNTYINGYKR